MSLAFLLFQHVNFGDRLEQSQRLLHYVTLSSHVLEACRSRARDCRTTSSTEVLQTDKQHRVTVTVAEASHDSCLHHNITSLKPAMTLAFTVIMRFPAGT